jgi:hypothetical protein
LEAARAAGFQVGTEGRMSKETLDIVGRELVSLDEYVEAMNAKVEKIVARPQDG